MHYINGDEFLDIGTAEELAKKYKVKKETTNKKRVKKNGKVAVRLDE